MFQTRLIFKIALLMLAPPCIRNELLIQEEKNNTRQVSAT